MGFYLKKGINFGPLRINFSKSGIGFSLGVKGFRVGSGPNGNYINAGRKGIYYRKNLPNLTSGEGIVIGWLPVLIIMAGVGVFYWAVKNNIITINL